MFSDLVAKFFQGGVPYVAIPETYLGGEYADDASGDVLIRRRGALFTGDDRSGGYTRTTRLREKTQARLRALPQAPRPSSLVERKRQSLRLQKPNDAERYPDEAVVAAFVAVAESSAAKRTSTSAAASPLRTSLTVEEAAVLGNAISRDMASSPAPSSEAESS